MNAISLSGWRAEPRSKRGRLESFEALPFEERDSRAVFRECFEVATSNIFSSECRDPVAHERAAYAQASCVPREVDV